MTQAEADHLAGLLNGLSPWQAYTVGREGGFVQALASVTGETTARAQKAEQDVADMLREFNAAHGDGQ